MAISMYEQTDTADCHKLTSDARYATMIVFYEGNTGKK
jgi:hypothetical protein